EPTAHLQSTGHADAGVVAGHSAPLLPWVIHALEALLALQRAVPPVTATGCVGRRRRALAVVLRGDGVGDGGGGGGAREDAAAGAVGACAAGVKVGAGVGCRTRSH